MHRLRAASLICISTVQAEGSIIQQGWYRSLHYQRRRKGVQVLSHTLCLRVHSLWVRCFVWVLLGISQWSINNLHSFVHISYWCAKWSQPSLLLFIYLFFLKQWVLLSWNAAESLVMFSVIHGPCGSERDWDLVGQRRTAGRWAHRKLTVWSKRQQHRVLRKEHGAGDPV